MKNVFFVVLIPFLSLFMSMSWAAKAPKKALARDFSIPSDKKESPKSSPRALTISNVYQYAYETDSKMDASRSELEANQYHYQADFSKAWGPQLSVTAGMVYGAKWINPSNFPVYNGWTLSGGLALIQPLFNYVQIIQADQSQFAASVSEVRNAVAQQDLIVRVTKAYLDVLRIQELIKIKEDEIAATKTHLEIVEEQFKVGLSTQVDLDEAKSKVAVAKAQKMDLESALITNQGVLSQTWGIDAAELKRLKAKIIYQAPSPNVPQKWIDQAVTLNLSVQYNNGLMEIAQYDIEKAKAALYYPSINLTAGCNAQGTSPTPFGSNATSTDGCSVGVGLSIPLFDGGYTPAKSKELTSIKERIRNDVRTTQIVAAQSARLAFASITKELSNIDFYQKSVQMTAEALQGKREQYLNGERTSFEILSTLQTLNQYKQQLVAEKYDFILNKIILKQAVGILSVVDLEELDALLE